MSENTAYVETLPKCDFCDKQASYDGATGFGGSWANMCAFHFGEYGLGLGQGIGQKLTTEKPKPKKTKAPSVATMERWLNDGIARATDGCKVEPDGYCQHGKPSWLIRLGLI